MTVALTYQELALEGQNAVPIRQSLPYPLTFSLCADICLRGMRGVALLLSSRCLGGCICRSTTAHSFLAEHFTRGHEPNTSIRVSFSPLFF